MQEYITFMNRKDANSCFLCKQMRSRSTQNKFSTAKRLKILCASESFGGLA